MVPARRQLDGLAGLDGKTLVERTHLHDAVGRGHLMDLDLAGNVGGDGNQPRRRASLVFGGGEPPPILAPFGVARLQACETTRSPALTSSALARVAYRQAASAMPAIPVAIFLMEYPFLAAMALPCSSCRV